MQETTTFFAEHVSASEQSDRRTTRCSQETGSQTQVLAILDADTGSPWVFTAGARSSMARDAVHILVERPLGLVAHPRWQAQEIASAKHTSCDVQ